MAELKQAQEPILSLFPIDFEIVMKLLPRAQIVVGDIPNIYPTLQRLEQAARSGKAFRSEAPLIEHDREA